MKAVGYIRVSSEMHVKQGHSLDMQHKLITDYVLYNGWIMSELFCDTAVMVKNSIHTANDTQLHQSASRQPALR